ncbi:hypothetical protein [Streptomyces avermitilis]|uniref:hypothetical protein n=1 Tax=Streptomyces avermitilis TaxID=33903 RepID=UPI00382EC6C6
MKMLPCTWEALVVRTDSSTGGTWDALQAALCSPSEDGFLANAHSSMIGSTRA